MTPFTETEMRSVLEDKQLCSAEASKVAQDIVDGHYDVAAFVERLGSALTSPSVELRVAGMKLLSSVLAELPPSSLKAAQLQFVVTFYCDRFKDHHSVIPEVISGMSALVQMDALPKECVPQLLRSLFAHTSCQSQVRSDRTKLYEIFRHVTASYGAEIKQMAGDFLCGLIAAIDGERDPRNLDLLFSFMPNFLTNFPLHHLAEEMFEVFACYFPIDFTPSSNDPDTITRDALEQKLSNCLVSSQEFVEWAIPLALEKLESDLTVAKLDALQLLHNAALKFPQVAMQPHFEEIWSALKAECFPGKDNEDVVGAALKCLGALLDTDSGHLYQTTVLGLILPHLSDVGHRLFDPSTSIALVCVASDPKFSGSKILNCFLLKLTTAESAEVPTNEQKIRIYTLLARIFAIIDRRGALVQIDDDILARLQVKLIESLYCSEGKQDTDEELDVKRAALSALNECVAGIDEANRLLLFKALLHLLMHQTIDLEFYPLLKRLGALYPKELQAHCIDSCIRNFPILTNFVKQKIYNHTLPLVELTFFTQLVFELILSHVFKQDAPQIAGDRLMALQALNTALQLKHRRFIVELQGNNSLVEQLIKLAQSTDGTDLATLEQIAASLSEIMQKLPIAEQYLIASTHLAQLNLELAPDLFVAKGLLGFLHQDISLDDQFEPLLNALIELSMQCEVPRLREVAHHLACSLVNKIEYNEANKNVVAALISKLTAEIKKGNAKAVEALSWVGKGLIVRGCEDEGHIIEAFAKLLDHPALSTAAALAFQIISAELPQLHLPLVKVLFKQKLFHMVLTKIGDKLGHYCENHLNAFIYVLKTTPHKVLKMNIEKVGPILFKCLESTHTHTLCISLEICENFVQHEDDYFRTHLNHLINSCLRLSTYENSMKVRITALNLLHDITRYQLYVLLPHKTDVVLGLPPALDDKKRLVRNAAVKARNKWFLLGTADAGGGKP